MQIAYTMDSEEAASRMLDGLLASGWREAVEAAGRNLREMESRLIGRFEAVREAAQRGDADAAMQLLFGAAVGGLTSEGKAFVERAQLEGPDNPQYLAKALLQSLQMIAPEGVYTPRLPLNLVAALSAAYHAVVLPRRCYLAAQQRIQNFGKQFDKLAILVVSADQDAPAYGPEEQMRSAVIEREFWVMFDLVVEHFQLNGVLKDVILSPSAAKEPVSVPEVEASATRQLALIAASRLVVAS
jgi:hypothetical protein